LPSEAQAQAREGGRTPQRSTSCAHAGAHNDVSLHDTFDPGGTSRIVCRIATSLFPLAASSIPFDSTLRITAGWRFATTITCFPRGRPDCR
jgi:hypothetical protein